MEIRVIREDVPEAALNYAKNKVRRLGLDARAVELVFNHRFDHVKVVGVDEHKVLTRFDVNTNSEEKRPNAQTGETGGAGNSIDKPAGKQSDVEKVQGNPRKENAQSDS